MRKIAEHLKKSSSVAIFVHVNPDWDCIGSAFALREALRSEKIKADIFTDEPLPHRLSFMHTDVIPYTAESCAPDYECYCAVDVGAADRMGQWGRFFTLNTNNLCIDHHHQTQAFAALSYVESARSSTGELIYELLKAGDFEITKDIASYIYCAISSDTGSFQYASVNRRTYEILIALTEAGINSSYLCSMLYEQNSLAQLRLKAEAINSICLYNEGRIATAKITLETMKKYNASKSETDALAQIPRSLEGVMISAFLKEVEGGDIRVSLRSLGDYDIEPVARHFGGGGHKKASGCTFKSTTIDEAERLLISELEKL